MLRLFLLSLTSLSALLIFQSGFLLKRNELHYNSTCADVKIHQAGCWLPKQYNKIVVILVDALRHDFLIPLAPNEAGSNFRGQMPGVGKLVEKGAVIATILADPPTTTLQRIKGLTTGTLPTFIDSADNFSPDAVVQEDNFVQQAINLNRTIRFFGDDTWFSLYPQLNSDKSHGYPSFDVTDLDTVDEAVRWHLESFFAQGSEVDLVIGHTLGVDHCGHKFGPKHPQMANILRRTDQLIYKTASSLHDGDLLIVLGDHGMTSTGDHGGDSDDETHAGLFMYAPGRQLTLTNGQKPLSQIDLVPTISLLLGVPIPFSNLGTVIRDLFPSSLRNLAVELNYEQVMRFANTYAGQHGFPELFDVTSRESTTAEDQLWTMRRVQEVLRRAWTRFDWPRMRTGIVSLLEATLFLFSGRAIDIPELIVRSGCLLLQFSVLWSNSEENLAFSLLMVVLPLSIFYSLGCLALSALTVRLKSSIHLVSILAVLVHGISFTSNSFVVYEGHVTRYLLQIVVLTACFIRFRCHINSTKSAIKSGGINVSGFLMTNEGLMSIVALVMLRLEPLYHRCREEEIGCETSFFVQNSGSLTSDARFWRLVLSWIHMAVFYIVVCYKSKPPAPFSLIWAISRLALVLIGIHQLVQIAITSSLVTGANLPLAAMYLALGVYFCTFSAVSIAIIYRKRASSFEIQKYVAFAISWTILLLLGDGLAPSFVAFIGLTFAVLYICDRDSLPWICSLLLPFGFYLTGHSPTISAIPWNAGFIGVPGNFFLKAVPGLLIGSHLYCANIMTILLLPMHPFFSFSQLYILIGASSIRSIFVSLAALIHRRHLMVWKIFAPHFIFEAVSFLALIGLVLIRCATLVNK